MKKSNFGKLLLLSLFVPLFLVGCSQSREKITIVGSSALQPLVEQAGNDYRLAHMSSNIVVQGGGSGTGLSQVQAGAVEVGTSDVFAETQKGIDAKKLEDYPVAVVGIVPIANKGVGVKNLSVEQLSAIFTGKIKNWREVGGKNQPIIVINRSRGSGTRSTFEDLILNGKDAVNSQEQDSNGTVKKIVNSTPGTISYISFPYANDQNIQKISIDHVKPDNKNIPTNKWPLWSYEHMYTKGKPNKATAAFIKYVLGKKVQTELVPKIGYISIHEMKVSRDSQNKVTKIGK
ncbi:MAG: phosphate ABC transporter substrate-binding protein [Lactobacillus helsingborgensis]|uniref:phosphate ABC transporter substrate-binding protein n=1 Tax=Lactobacillus TaxID=1578 RepID=UPI000D6FC5F8|nr:MULTISPECIES: phosphate ABC transporter substrate-binding protein [Lactobacillus]AWN33809.1 phosphate ABC transporter substrate-binding protein [Lactobacillus helsingborgensis]MBC6357089.1 phosphate ABC transporter substrate-binding protein [Lactobacillus helsingborgensis]MCT6828120.1 phosphate ABC transporter substrate-binding protein [Lactobacillus helsingborgensis]MCT6847251.1 phosphate ABC transporter substrate-binding protein [Lactobacillus helsingborgensis]RMC52210.1 phosphate ABC tra